MLTKGGEQSFIAPGDGRITGPHEDFIVKIDGVEVPLPLAGEPVRKGQRIAWMLPEGPQRDPEGPKFHFE